MNKKTITKILVLSVLLILFSLNIKASIFATIGMKGLSFASPQAAQVVQNVMEAYQITTDPSGFITGEMTGKITGEIMGEIAKQSPEAAKAIQQYQQVKGWVDEGAKITEDLKMDSKGGLSGGSMVLNDKERELGPMINPDNKDLSVKATNMEVSTQGEGADVSLTAKKDGYVEINGKRYNLKENSKMIIDRNGSIKETDATFSEATNIELGGTKYDVPKNGRIVYKDGVAEIITSPGETVKINNQEIKIGGGSIKYDGEKITGKDFTYDEKRFTGIGDKPAEMTPVNEGYLLGKDTKMEDDRMTITSEKGKVLYSKMCGDVSGFNNYVNPCMKKLTVEGDGFSLQLKEGKQFGLDIEKNDLLKYDFNGGKVVLNNGEQTIIPQKDGNVIITNGDLVTKYVEIDGEVQALVDPNTLGKNIDVSMSSVYDKGRMGSTTNEETNTEIIQVCSKTIAGTGSTGTAITDTKSITTFANVGGNCPKIVSLGGKNGILTDNDIKKKLKKWGDATITNVYPVYEYEWPPGSGKISYGRIIETQSGKDVEQTFIASDGRYYAISGLLPPQKYPNTISKEDLKKFGLLPTDNTAPTAEEVGIKWERDLPNDVKKKIEACNKLGEQVTGVTGGPAAVYFKGIGTGNKIKLEGYDEYFIHVGEGIYEGQISGERFQEYPKGSGKYVKVNP